jgi:hypothetical protein
MHASAKRACLLVLTVMTLFGAGQLQPVRGQEKAIKDQSKRSGCVCIKFMYADLGETEIYYAHEYDECIEELCPFPYVTYYTGSNLPVNQQCPDGCLSKSKLKRQGTEQPKLDAAKPDDWDIHDDGDDEVKLNSEVWTRPKGSITRIMVTEDGDEIPIKIFFTKVRSLSVTAVAAFGVEVEEVEDDEREVTGKLVEGFDHLYCIQLTPQHQCLVVTAQ